MRVVSEARNHVPVQVRRHVAQAGEVDFLRRDVSVPWQTELNVINTARLAATPAEFFAEYHA